MINEEFVLVMIEPYLNSKRELSEFEFYELFSGLNRKEQYEVIDIMIRNDIDYVDEKVEESRIFSQALILEMNNDKDNYKKLLHLKNEQLCVMYQDGDLIALTALIDKNKRFVYQLAWKLHNQYNQITLSIDDLYEEGNLGLIEAAKHFDVSMDNQFITYCWHWVRQKITREVMESGFMIRLPVYVFENIIKINKYRKLYPMADVDKLLEMLNEEKTLNKMISKEELQNYFLYADAYLNTSSLNVLVGEDNDSELMDYIPNGAKCVEDNVIDNILAEDITAVLQSLKPREAQVINMRFGLDGNPPMTLETIGKYFSVTRERIRQIEVKAMKKLRHPTRSKKLENYMEGM